MKNLKTKLADCKKSYDRWRGKRRFRNRDVTKASFLYYFIIISSVLMFGYAIISLLAKGLPFWITFLPLIILAAYLIFAFIRKNWRMMWLYVSDMEQGRLLLYLNDHTAFSTEHKRRLVNWVYPKSNYVRNELLLKLKEDVKNGIELSAKERLQINRKAVFCPQQLLDGVNKAFLVDALIYAHENILPLDDDLRDKLELTDDNIMKFDLRAEIDKCRRKEDRKKYDKLIEIGMRKVKENGN